MKKSGCSVQISFFVEMYRNPEHAEEAKVIGKVVPKSGTQSNIELHQGFQILIKKCETCFVNSRFHRRKGVAACQFWHVFSFDKKEKVRLIIGAKSRLYSLKIV